MIYVVFVFAFIAIVAGLVAYVSVGKNKKLKEDLEWTRKELAKEAVLRVTIEEANKTYVQKLATLSKGTDADRFAAATSIMSDSKAPPSK